MVISTKDAFKLIGVLIISCCAVFVCTLFLNFYFDVKQVKGAITTESALIFYNAQVSTAKVVCLVSGGCLLITSAVMLVFYVKHYIDTHKKELGILKAMGYSNFKIAKHFWTFGLSVFMGTLIGFGGAFLIMQWFYNIQNEDQILPKLVVNFHPIIFFYFVVLPTIGFILLAIGYAWWKLKSPVLALLKNDYIISSSKKKHRKDKISNNSFINDLKINTLKSKKILVFFIMFASFCFSAMTQMAFSMKDLSSEVMGMMILTIGLVLAYSTLFIAVTTVVDGNTPTIAMMRAFGYSQSECGNAVLGGYRPMTYIGFGIGTLYQYLLLKIMVTIVFKNVDGVPPYKFDFPIMLISLVIFIISYELLMYRYFQKIKKISIKEIMVGN